MAEDKNSELRNSPGTDEYELRIPPGTPNMEELISAAMKLFKLKLISPKDLDEPYYLALRGDLDPKCCASRPIRKASLHSVCAPSVIRQAPTISNKTSKDRTKGTVPVAYILST